MIEEIFTYDSFLLEITPESSKKYKICESVAGDEKIISSLDEAIEYSLSIVNGWSDFFEERLDEQISPTNEKRAFYLSTYEECLRDKVVDTVQEAWKNRDQE